MLTFYRFVRYCLRAGMLTVGFFAAIAAVTMVLVLAAIFVSHPAFFATAHRERLLIFPALPAGFAIVGGAMIWAGRKLRYHAFAKADPKTAECAEYVVYTSGAPVWIDPLAVAFVSLGVGGLLYLTGDYNPSSVVPRLLVGFGAVWLLPRVWLRLSNDASKDLRWTLRRFYPDKPLLWDNGSCLCVDGQQIPWRSVAEIESRADGFAQYITVTAQDPWASIDVDLSLALESPKSILDELTKRRMHKGAAAPRFQEILAENRAPRELIGA